MHRHATDVEASTAFLRWLYPRLVAEHDYLDGRRRPGGSSLPVFMHPWESGLDNSPAWDRDLAGHGHPAGLDPALRPPRPRPREPEGPADQRGLRPVRVPGGRATATPGTTTTGSSTRCRSSSPGRCSTRSTCGRRTRWRRSPRSSARTRSRIARTRGGSTTRCSRELWDPETKPLRRARRHRARAERRGHDHLVRAAARPGPAEGAARRDHGRPPVGALPSGPARRRSSRRATTCSAADFDERRYWRGPGLDQHQLAAVDGPPPARPARRGGGDPR